MQAGLNAVFGHRWYANPATDGKQRPAHHTARPGDPARPRPVTADRAPIAETGHDLAGAVYRAANAARSAATTVGRRCDSPLALCDDAARPAGKLLYAGIGRPPASARSRCTAADEVVLFGSRIGPPAAYACAGRLPGADDDIGERR